MNYYVIIIGFILLVLLIIYTIRTDMNKKKRLESECVYIKRTTCEYKSSPSLIEFFNNYGIKNGYEDFSSDIESKRKIFIPCTYDDIEKEINEMEKTNDNYYMIINKCDLFVGKNYLWNFLKSYYGNNVTKYVPKSYITYNFESMEELKKDFNKDKLYIMKKNVQRQEGIKITNDLNVLTDAIKDEYIIIQDLLQNPFLINGRKINLRVYVLVVIKDKDCSTYVYSNGFMYYTPKAFIKGSMDLDRNVTTGYIDRKVYEENPLTHDDFRKYLGKKKEKIIFDNIYKLIKNIMSPLHEYLIKFQSFPGSTQFQIFGSDVAVNDDMTSTLMEINKGPDLGYKDERDGEVKKNLIEDMFNLIGAVQIDKVDKIDKVNRFIKVA